MGSTMNSRAHGLLEIQIVCSHVVSERTHHSFNQLVDLLSHLLTSSLGAPFSFDIISSVQCRLHASASYFSETPKLP